MTRMRRLLLIGGIVGIVVLLAAIGWFLFSGVRDSADSTINRLVAQLPGSDDADREIGRDSDDTGRDVPSGSQPIASNPSLEIPTRGLAVTVKYQRNPGFSLSIDEVRHVEEQSTIQHYAPAEGAPYSIIRVLDDGGRTIAEDRFSVTTGGIFEGPDIPAQTIELEESMAYLVLPIPESSQPARVQIATPSSVIFDEVSVPQRTVFESIKNFLATKIARAAEGDETFIIVVMNDASVGFDTAQNVAQRARGILTIEPWATYRGKVEIVSIANSVDFGCAGPGEPTTCANDGLAASIASQQVPGWDAIVIVTGVACDCGFVGQGFPPITAVGQHASARLIVHELGHSIGKMVDEYTHFEGNFTPLAGAPNCFDDQPACLAALRSNKVDGQPGAECLLRCDGASRWRPATRIMHNLYNPLQFGPLEECFMGRRIASAIGEEHDCEKDTPSPVPTPSPGNYWGWIRR